MASATSDILKAFFDTFRGGVARWRCRSVISLASTSGMPLTHRLSIRSAASFTEMDSSLYSISPSTQNEIHAPIGSISRGHALRAGGRRPRDLPSIIRDAARRLAVFAHYQFRATVRSIVQTTAALTINSWNMSTHLRLNTN